MMYAYKAILQNLFSIDGIDSAVDALRAHRLPPSVELAEYILRLFSDLGFIELDDQIRIKKQLMRNPKMAPLKSDEFRIWLYLCLITKTMSEIPLDISDRALLLSLLGSPKLLPKFGKREYDWPCKFMPDSIDELSRLITLLDFDLKDIGRQLVMNHVVNCINGLPTSMLVLAGRLSGGYVERANELELNNSVQSPELFTRYGTLLLRVAASVDGTGFPMSIRDELRSDAARFISLGEFSEIVPCPRGVKMQTMVVVCSAFGNFDALRTAIQSITLTYFRSRIKQMLGHTKYFPTPLQIERLYSQFHGRDM